MKNPDRDVIKRVHWGIGRAVRWSVSRFVSRSVNKSMSWSTYYAVDRTLWRAVDRTVNIIIGREEEWAVHNDSEHPALQEFLSSYLQGQRWRGGGS